tara:strand:- start:938 stop:1129 length:192 start_codon:yes stop_codon:yes gene_type:complete
MTDRSIKDFENKLKIKLAKIGFNPKWLESGKYVESMSSRELVTFDDMANMIIEQAEEYQPNDN